MKEWFPQLSEKVYGKPLVYLDNAATSLRPQSVIDKWTEMSVKYNSNLHRAVHYTAAKATGEYEDARKQLATFIGAKPSQIVFTSGTTASLNLLAFSFGEYCVGEGDEIIIAESEHHSDIVPWQMLCQRKKSVIKVLPVDDYGCLRFDLLESLISDKTRLLAVAQISNVLGIRNPVKEIVKIAHSHGVKVLVDGAQGVVHDGADVRDMDFARKFMYYLRANGYTRATSMLFQVIRYMLLPEQESFTARKNCLNGCRHTWEEGR